jgi:hypothetical protein
MAAVVRPGGVLDRFDRRRCRARAVERFGSDRMVAEHERLYRAVVARAAGRPPDDRARYGMRAI